MTGEPGAGTLLIQTAGASPAAVGAAAAGRVGQAAAVTTIETSRKQVASSLTSVELAGLTRVELAYALILVAAATGLLLWLGLAERRRTFAIAQALGARPRQLAGFVWTETGFVTLTGLFLGTIGAAWLTWMLVKLLTGVFDPPPTRPAVPWTYLATVAVVAAAAVAAAGLATLRTLRNPGIETLRDL
jgi:putative ABC transport system permease protein